VEVLGKIHHKLEGRINQWGVMLRASLCAGGPAHTLQTLAQRSRPCKSILEADEEAHIHVNESDDSDTRNTAMRCGVWRCRVAKTHGMPLVAGHFSQKSH